LRVFYKPNLWEGENTRELALHVVLAGPVDEGVEGPQLLGGPRQKSPYTRKILMGNDILKLFNPRRQRYLLILSMIKKFSTIV